MAAEAEPLYAEEAKKRQQEAGGDRRSEEYRESVVQNFEQPIPDVADENTRKANTQAAKTTGANRQYVAEMKKIKREGLSCATRAGLVTSGGARIISAVAANKEEYVDIQLPDPPPIVCELATVRQLVPGFPLPPGIRT